MKHKINFVVLVVVAMVITVVSVSVGSAQIESDSEATPTTEATPALEKNIGSGMVIIPVVENEHPYPNNFDDFWLVPNIDTQADATRLFFSKLELENEVDWLILMDAQDTEIQRISGSYPDGLWSEPIPGNLAKLHLVTDTSVRRWGFALEGLETVSMPSLGHSSHPYPNNAEQRWSFTNLDPNAEGTRLHFSRLELEDNVDWLVIMDSTETPFQWVTGHHPEGLWTNSVPGNGVIVQLISDTSVNDWGFNIDQIESFPPADPVVPRVENDTSLAESPHPYLPNSSETWTLVNPNPAAAFSKVHFTRLDLEGGDNLVLYDGDDNRVQVFEAGTHQSDFWSDDIPGRVVKIELNVDQYNNVDWGFRIDQLVDGEERASLAESPHPYLPNSSETWTLVNPNPAAAFSKVHFTRLDLEGGDNLVLYDGDDNRVQVFEAGTHQSDFWSDDIPGRVVKIELNVDQYNNVDWGFRIDQLVDGEERASLAESPHPYLPNSSETWTLVNPNPAAAFSKVHFTRLDLEGGDNLVLYDGDDNRVQVFEAGTHQSDFWSDDIPGRVVKIELNVDQYNNVDWGFRIDQITPQIDTTPIPAFVNGIYVYVSQPGNLYVNDILKGRASTPGDYRLTLPGLGENVITVETLFHRQEILVNTGEDGTVRIEYKTPEPIK